MSERVERLSSGSGVESIGAYLAGQRRIRGISAQQLAEITRIPLRSIRRLEEGSFDADLDGFARGFVRTVAEALGLDPHETLTRMLREPSGGDARASDARRRLGGLVALVAVAALLIGLGALVREGLRAFSGSPVVQPDYVYRRDPVRDLAEAQGPYVPLATALAPPPGESVRGVQSAHPQ